MPATLALMFEPNYQPHPMIPGIGLAFDRYNMGGRLAIGHEGVLPGSDLPPDDVVGVVALTNGTPGSMFWLPAEALGLLKQLLRVPDDLIRSDIPQHPESWNDLCGSVRPSGGPNRHAVARHGRPGSRGLRPRWAADASTCEFDSRTVILEPEIRHGARLRKNAPRMTPAEMQPLSWWTRL